MTFHGRLDTNDIQWNSYKKNTIDARISGRFGEVSAVYRIHIKISLSTLKFGGKIDIKCFQQLYNLLRENKLN